MKISDLATLPSRQQGGSDANSQIDFYVLPFKLFFEFHLTIDESWYKLARKCNENEEKQTYLDNFTVIEGQYAFKYDNISSIHCFLQQTIIF